MANIINMQASDKLEALEFWFPTPPVFNYQAMQTQKSFLSPLLVK